MFTLRKHAHASVKHGTRFTIHFRIEGPLVFRVSLFRLDLCWFIGRSGCVPDTASECQANPDLLGLKKPLPEN